VDPLAIVLVGAAAVCHALWNLAAKKAADAGAVFVWINSLGSGVIYLPVVAVAAVAYPPRLSWALAGAILVTGVLHVAYSLVLQRGYQRGDLSVVYPLARGTGPLLSVGLAIALFHEKTGVVGLAGAAGVVGGIFVIGFQPGRRDAALAAGIGYGVLTGVFIAAYTVFDAWAVGPLAISPILYDWGNNLVRAALLTPHAWKHRTEIHPIWTKYRGPILTVASIAPAAYILVLFAYRFAPVSLVAPARELSIVVGSVFAWLLLREPQAGRRVAGACLVLAGVVALATAH
jgi:drug/metabolite transporter (DMT)-like permease